MNTQNESKQIMNTSKTAVFAQEAYEAKVGTEALVRQGGYNPQLKGVVHEVLFCDQYNANPENILAGRRAELTKSVTAIRDDIVIKENGKVVGRMQLKDTPHSIGHTIEQVKNQKYVRTNLMGTEETTAAYAEKAAKYGKDGIQQMKSTGISSKDTSRIADKTLGNQVSAESIFHGAGTAGTVGAVASAAVELIGMAVDGEQHSAGEVFEETAKAGATGYVSSAAGFAGAEVAANVVRGAVAGIGAASAAGSIAAAILPGAAAVGGAIVAGKAAAEFATPVVEGIADAVRFKSPSLIGFGIQEGLMNVGDFIEDLPIVGGLFSTICSWFI